MTGKSLNPKEIELRKALDAVVPDGYLDEEEERGLAQKAIELGVADKFDAILVEECARHGAIRGKAAAGEIYNYLKSRYGDKKIPGKEVDSIKKWCQSLIPENNPDKDGAEQQLMNKAVEIIEKYGVKQSSAAPVVIGIVVGIAVVGGAIFMLLPKKTQVVEKERVVTETKLVKPTPRALSQEEKTQIDNLLAKMSQHIEAGKYTDPPEDCAKMDLDAIRRIDPKGTYKGSEIEDLVSKIVESYIGLARRAHEDENPEATRKWISRARLFFRDSEIIREFEKEIGLVETE